MIMVSRKFCPSSALLLLLLLVFAALGNAFDTSHVGGSSGYSSRKNFNFNPNAYNDAGGPYAPNQVHPQGFAPPNAYSNNVQPLPQHYADKASGVPVGGRSYDNPVFHQNHAYEKRIQYPPTATDRFTPPTTYKEAARPYATDSFYDVINPQTDKRNAISSYVPQNNFVDPKHYVIGTDDKYKMVKNVFDGYGQQPHQQPGPAVVSNNYQNVGPGFNSYGQGFDNQCNVRGYDQQQNINPLGYGHIQKKTIRRQPNSPYGVVNSHNSKAFHQLQPAAYPGPHSNQNIYNAPSKPAVPVYSGNTVISGGRSQIYAPPQPKISGDQSSFATGKGYQAKQGYTNHNGRTFDNNYNTAPSRDADHKVTRNFGSRNSGDIAPKSFGTFSGYQSEEGFKSNPSSSSPRQGSNVFSNKNSAIPLFDGFTNNNRLNVDAFRAKNLLGNDNFGKTEYDRSRPNSLNLIEKDAYQIPGYGQIHPSAHQPSSQYAYDKGGVPLGNVVGNTQIVGKGYDNVHRGNQGYSRTYDDGVFNPGRSNDYGVRGTSGYPAIGFSSTSNEQKSLPNQGSITKTYQEADSFKDGGSFSDGNQYARNSNYSKANSDADQRSNSDRDHKDFKDGFNNQKHATKKNTVSNSDGYNKAFKDGNKYDVQGSYTDNVNYNRKDADSGQAQYTTKDGYKEGVANVGAALKGRNPSPYVGLKTPVTKGLSPDANYKPFDVNGPVFGGSFF